MIRYYCTHYQWESLKHGLTYETFVFELSGLEHTAGIDCSFLLLNETISKINIYKIINKNYFDSKAVQS